MSWWMYAANLAAAVLLEVLLIGGLTGGVYAGINALLSRRGLIG